LGPHDINTSESIDDRGYPDAGRADEGARGARELSRRGNRGGARAGRTREVSELQEVRQALGRIASGTYGVCQECGEPIPVERLRAFPTARYDVGHQQAREESSGA
jgi:RNA polymerase-binding transcription factor DksA